MPITVVKNYVASPSVAPTTNNTSGTLQVVHRRYNLDGLRSSVSPVRTTGLPAIFTPQNYAISGDVLKDEFLISSDGVTWRQIPRENVTGAQTVSNATIDTSWPIVSLGETQLSPINSFNFGSLLGSTTSPIEFYIVNSNPSNQINSLTFTPRDELNRIATDMNDRLEISLLGTSNVSGTGSLSTGQNNTVLFNAFSNQQGVGCILPVNNFAKLQARIINYPVAGLTKQIAYSLTVTPNQFLFANTDPLWPNLTRDDNGTLNADVLRPVRLASNFNVVLKQGVAFNINNTIVRAPADVSYTLPTGLYRVTASLSRGLVIEAQSAPLGSQEYDIFRFELNSGGGFVATSFVYTSQLRGTGFSRYQTVTTNTPYRFVVTTGGAGGFTYGLSTAGAHPQGVSCAYNPRAVITSGRVILETAGTAIAQGDRLRSNASGQAVPDNTSVLARAIALESSTVAGSLIAAILI